MHHNSSDNAVDYDDAGRHILEPAVSAGVDDSGGGSMSSLLAVPAEAGDCDVPRSHRSGQQRGNFYYPCLYILTAC